MQKFSFHTHSVFSDGQNTVFEMVEQATRLGFEKIGVSDHLSVHKNIIHAPSYQETKKISHQSFDEVVDICNKHAEDIRKAQKIYGVKTYVGYEVDYFTYNGWEEEFRDFLKKIDYDYLITGNHFLMSQNGEDIFDIWRFSNYSERVPENIKVYIKRHFETLQKAVRSKLFLFLAHMDYVQKIKDYRQEDYQQEIDSIVAALKETNTASEISTKGIRKFGHFFPSESILEKLIKNDVALIVSDDAHSINELGSYFDDAEQELLLLKCNKRLVV